MAKKETATQSAAPKVVHLRRRVILYAVGGVVLVIGSFVVYVAAYSSTVLPHVSVAGASVSGKTLPGAVEVVERQVESTIDLPIRLKLDDKTTEIHAADMGLVIDAEATAERAYALGRQESFLRSLWDDLVQIAKQTDIPFVMTYDTGKLDKLVADFATTVDQPEVNAGVKVDGGKVVETSASVGHRVDQVEIKSVVLARWQNGTPGEIVVSREAVQPTITTGNTSEAIKQAEQLRTVKTILKAEGKDYTVPQATLDSMITSEVDQGVIRASLNGEVVKQWLNKIAPQVNVEAQEAKLAMSGEKVTIFAPGKEGRVINIDVTKDKMTEAVRAYIKEGKSDKIITAAAEITVTKPQVTDQNISSLGIEELVSSGTTSFVGSPENRKHNIAVGAKALNGILVKPGEEFSVLKNLGKIDGASGYLPELVIKVDKTEPEFGGGLCQVSTTLFRSALNAGLKITERRNHRYRVSYYEPPVGKDATIYEGSPDLKFVNDTPSYLLIQSHIEGTKITFDIYGKKDGRRNEQTDPVVYDVTSPPEPEYIQTDTLPEGTTKQTEKPHPGAKASFNYTVFNADGSVRHKQTFVSKYVPWRARFLVGTKKADPPPTEPPVQ